MSVFLLIVIVCILLFGGAAVLGVAGAVIGMIASAILIAVFAQVPVWAWAVAAVGLGGLAIWAFNYQANIAARRQAETDARLAKHKAEMAELAEQTAEREATFAQIMKPKPERRLSIRGD